jgi:hypothetical protein
MTRFIPAAAVTAALLFVAGSAAANPKLLPFTYPYGTLPKGGAELENYVDFTPTKAFSAATGQPSSISLFTFQTEYEYGITDRLELGLYLQIAPPVGDDYASVATISPGTAIKQRLRLRLAEAGDWPVDVSLYGEVVEARNELEFEAKINLERRFGKLSLMANLVGELEVYFDGKREIVLNPSAGAAFEVTPWFHTGIEYWMHSEHLLTDPLAASNPTVFRPFSLGPHHYVGPTTLLNFGRVWWSAGVYFRASDATRVQEVGDGFGHLWVRSIIGLDLQ